MKNSQFVSKFHELTFKKRKHKFNSVSFLTALSGFIFTLAGLVLVVLLNTLSIYNQHNLYQKLWAQIVFGVLSFMTSQGNIMVLIYWLFFLVLFKTRIFATHKFGVFVWSYANFVMLAYWMIVFPQWISGNAFDNSAISMTSSIIQHLVTPLLFNIHMIASSNYPYQKRVKNVSGYIYSKTFILVLASYAVIYLAYVIGINFISLPIDTFRTDLHPVVAQNHSYITIYGLITNFNSHCFSTKYDESMHLVFDDASSGKLFNLLFVFAIFVFYILLGYLLIFINNRLCTSKNWRINYRKLINNKDRYSYFITCLKKLR